MACGYVVYDIFDDTKNYGLFRQLFIYFYFLTFYTSVNEIFVSIIMEGYDRCTIRKEIDNDDPFPVAESLTNSLKRSFSEESQANTSLSYLAPSPLSALDSSPLMISRGSSVLSFDEESDLMTVCKYLILWVIVMNMIGLNKLNRKKTEVRVLVKNR